jgi:hypothetical protein
MGSKLELSHKARQPQRMRGPTFKRHSREKENITTYEVATDVN